MGAESIKRRTIFVWRPIHLRAAAPRVNQQRQQNESLSANVWSCASAPQKEKGEEKKQKREKEIMQKQEQKKSHVNEINMTKLNISAPPKIQSTKQSTRRPTHHEPYWPWTTYCGKMGQIVAPTTSSSREGLTNNHAKNDFSCKLVISMIRIVKSYSFAFQS